MPPNDTLLIQAGVVVVSSQPPNRRYILPYEDSTIRIQGSQASPVTFISVGIDATVTGNQVFAQRLVMTNGWIQTWGNALRFEADGCTFLQTEINSRGRTNLIRQNVFVGSPFSDLSNTLLQNNVFLGWSGELMRWPMTSTIRLNSFLDTGLTVIRSSTFDISQNYWGTTNVPAFTFPQSTTRNASSLVR